VNLIERRANSVGVSLKCGDKSGSGVFDPADRGRGDTQGLRYSRLRYFLTGPKLTQIHADILTRN
jgi:hypothetical protein